MTFQVKFRVYFWKEDGLFRIFLREQNLQVESNKAFFDVRESPSNNNEDEELYNTTVDDYTKITKTGGDRTTIRNIPIVCQEMHKLGHQVLLHWKRQVPKSTKMYILFKK